MTKIDGNKKQLIIFRQGAITQVQLQRELDRMGMVDWSIIAMSRTITMHGTEEAEEAKEKKKEEKVGQEEAGQEEVGQEAPGQAVTHYAPDVPCFIVESLHDSTTITHEGIEGETVVIEKLQISSQELLQQCVVIDFGQALIALQDTSLAYCDLSIHRNPAEAARNLFSSLRWAEAVPGATKVLVCTIRRGIGGANSSSSCGGRSGGSSSSSGDSGSGSSSVFRAEAGSREGTAAVEGDGDMSMGVADRVFRAASGKSVHLQICGV